MSTLERLYHHYNNLFSKDIAALPFVQKNLHTLPFVAVILYALTIFLLPKILKKSSKKVGLEVVGLMKWWNLFLSVTSGIMFFAVGIPYVRLVLEDGFEATMCDANSKLFQPIPMYFFGSLFVYFKYAELLDTVFILIKNPERKVQFLHWYHHITVLLFSWYGMVWKYSAGYYFMYVWKLNQND